MPSILSALLDLIVLPLLLLFSAVNALKLRHGARVGLLVYAWISLGLLGYALAARVYNEVRLGSLIGSAYHLAYNIDFWSNRAVYPLIILYLLTRPQIRALFTRPSRGFQLDPIEPLAAGDTGEAPGATHPAPGDT